MKAILLNDTRSVGHFGCDLVISNTLAEADRAGIRIVATVPNADPEQASKIVLQNEATLVLLNGEGTMHDDQPSALAFARAAKAAKAAGKRVVLYNTVWQNNRELNAYLSTFDLIYTRESLSAASLLEAGAKNRTVPDLIFATIPTKDPSRSATLSGVFIDSVHRHISKRLARLAILRGCAFLPMSKKEVSRLQIRPLLSRLLRWRSGAPCSTLEGFMDRIAAAPWVCSGRFHGTCLALLLGKPVASVASNTQKVEGLYKDIGFVSSNSRDWVRPLPCVDWQAFWDQLRIIGEQMDRAQRYVAAARQAIRDMFTEIAKLQVN